MSVTREWPSMLALRRQSVIQGIPIAAVSGHGGIAIAAAVTGAYIPAAAPAEPQKSRIVHAPVQAA
jgi:hypothetical protein